MSVRFISRRMRCALVMLLWVTAAATVRAQPYSIDWYKVAGGGGSSSNGQYSVSGTIGQPDASTAMTGGNYSLTGGFWALYAIQSPGAPILHITYTNNRAVVFWDPAVTGFTLQTNNNLTSGVWSNYPGTVANNSVTNSPPQGTVFFRLKQ